MQPRPAHPRGVSAGPRMGAGGFPGGRQGAGQGVLGKMVSYLQWRDRIQRHRLWGG